MYILGLLDSHNDENSRSNDIQEVYAEAKRLSEENYESTYGIWANEGDDLLAIAHEGQLFLRAAS